MTRAVAGILAVAFFFITPAPGGCDQHYRQHTRYGLQRLWRWTVDANQLRALISETLTYLSPDIPYSADAVELLLLTAAQETQLGRWIKQIRGPARGIFQVEPESEAAMLAWLQAKYPEGYARLMALNAAADGQGTAGDQDMVFNLKYQAAAARWFYKWKKESRGKPEAIPTDRAEQALYYKALWNTAAGKATAAEALLAYRRFVDGVKV